MTRTHGFRLAALLGAALVVLSTVGFLGTGHAATPGGTVPSVPAASSTGTLWAYGVQQNVSLSVAANHTTYQIRGWFAYHVILTQTNTSTSTFQIEVNRTIGFLYTASYCSPSCGTGARVAVSISVKAWEHDVGFANFTRAGTVYENGSPVPATALTNSSARAAANLTEKLSYSVDTLMRHASGASALYVASASSAEVQFTPPLGLVPSTLTAGSVWNSTSQYAAQGQASVAADYYRTLANGTTLHGAISAHPAVTASGTVAVVGRDLGTLTLRTGQQLPVVGFAILGPFQPREGIVWVPAGADLFGAASATYSAQANGGVSASTATVDWSSSLHGHMGLYASATGFVPAPDAAGQMGGDPATMALASTTTSPITAAVSAASGAGTEIQAQPESVGQAQAGSACIVSGSCGVPAPSSPAGRFTGALLIGGAVVVVGALLAGLAVSRRRVPRPPASATPSYPPEDGSRPLPPPRRPPNSPDAPEPDPLGHLW